MKIRCDVCEKASAAVICCADEAALCLKCDVEIHAANKLASKHHRLNLHNLSNKLPKCDICQEKAAFIFCVEDRALFCKNCDASIHSAGTHSANHQRFLATGIRVALASDCSNDAERNHVEPRKPNRDSQQISVRNQISQHSSSFASAWAVDDFLQFSESDSSSKKEPLGFGELEWFSDMGLFEEGITQEAAMAAAEVPQLLPPQTSNVITSLRAPKSYPTLKKPRLEILDEDFEHFTVPDLG